MLLRCLRRIEENASRFSAEMNPTTVPQDVFEMSVGCVNSV